MHNGFASFYRGKKVLVTGHTGFKGGWLASWLKLLGAEVTGFARPPATEPNLFTAASVDIGMQSVIGEIQDLTQVRDLFNRVQPEIVIHNAAQAIVRRSYRDPVETYATNVMGTVHILAATQQTLSVRAVVIVTSDKCYENRERVDGYREEDPMGGHDPYSSSKGAAELITAAYRRSFFSGQGSAAIASVRAGNVIGGGDWSEDRLIPDIARAISSDTPIIIRSPGSIRPWQHVLEPLRGYLLVAERLWREGRKYQRTLEAGQCFVHGIFGGLGIVENNSGEGREFLIDRLDELFLIADFASPGFVLVGLEANVEFAVEETSGIGAIVGTS